MRRPLITTLTLLAWGLALSVATRSVAADDKKEDGFASLFDGRTMKGWVGDSDGYKVENGELVALETGHPNLWTEKEYGDFDLKFEYQLSKGGNNGIGIRSPMKGKPHIDGTEIQVLDDDDPQYKDIKPYQANGSVYGIVPAERGHLKPLGQWNEEEIIAQGSHIKIILNGATIVDAELTAANTSKTLDGEDHPGARRDKGHIGLLGHESRVAFRNLRIKDLSAKK